MKSNRKPTAFMQFWNALNKTMKRRGVPEVTFGPARELWAEVCHEAERLFYSEQVRQQMEMEGARRR